MKLHDNLEEALEQSPRWRERWVLFGLPPMVGMGVVLVAVLSWALFAVVSVEVTILGSS